MRAFPLVPTLGLALLWQAIPARAQTPFEGSITYEMVEGDTRMQMTQSMKGSWLRQEMQGPRGPMTVLMEVGSPVLTMLMPPQRMYMKFDPSAASPMIRQMMGGQSQQSSPQPEATDFRATGRTSTVAGHSCEHFEVASATGKVDICVAKGLGFLPFVATGGMSNGPSAAQVEAWKARFKDGFLPLQITVTGGKTVTMTATSVEAKSLPDDFFQVPAGYTEMRMPGRR